MLVRRQCNTHTWQTLASTKFVPVQFLARLLKTPCRTSAAARRAGGGEGALTAALLRHHPAAASCALASFFLRCSARTLFVREKRARRRTAARLFWIFWTIGGTSKDRPGGFERGKTGQEPKRNFLAVRKRQ